MKKSKYKVIIILIALLSTAIWVLREFVVEGMQREATVQSALYFTLMVVPLLFCEYIIQSLVFQSIYKKSGYKNYWMAWIPVLYVIPYLRLVKFKWWIITLLLLPLLILRLNIIHAMQSYVGGLEMVLVGLKVWNYMFLVVSIFAFWKIFERAGYSKWLSLLTVVPVVKWVVWAIVAWEKPAYPNIEKE